ncbi:MAG TPA: helix-turn-helix transcriptional regulator [Pseudonocardia sp.]
MPTETRQEVADVVRAELARRRIGQREVAQALEMSQPAVSRRLAGEVAFDVDDLAKLAGLLEMDPRDLLPAATT